MAQKIIAVSAIAICVVIGAELCKVVAQKASVPKPQNNLALGEDEVKQLLILIGADKNGKVTKQAWMTFMEAEFDRLDKTKSGELNANELAHSRLRVSHPVSVGK